MKFFVFIPLFATVLSFSSTAPGKPEKPDQSQRVLYRTVNASPDEFISAMRTATPSEAHAPANDGSFEKYFEVTKRVVTEKSVSFQIGMKMRALPEFASRMTSGDIVMTELQSVENHRRFSVRLTFSENSSIDSILTVFPDKAGCRLKLEIERSTLPDWMLNRAIETVLQFNLARSQAM